MKYVVHSLLLISRTLERTRHIYSLNRTRRKYLRPLPLNRMRKKHSIPLPLNRTRRRYQRRRRSTNGVLPVRRGAPDEVYNALYFTHQQNAEKVPETKKEGRRRTSSTSRPSWWCTRCFIHVLKRVLNEFGSTVLQYSPQSPPASHCLCRFRWA